MGASGQVSKADRLRPFAVLARLNPPHRTLRQLAVIEYLEANGPSRSRDIAYGVLLNKESLCRALEALEADGLVQSERSPVDNRRQSSSLTQAGRDAIGGLRLLMSEPA